MGLTRHNAMCDVDAFGEIHKSGYDAGYADAIARLTSDEARRALIAALNAHPKPLHDHEIGADGERIGVYKVTRYPDWAGSCVLVKGGFVSPGAAAAWIRAQQVEHYLAAVADRLENRTEDGCPS